MAYDLSFDLDSVALFGENMFGIHSIEYAGAGAGGVCLRPSCTLTPTFLCPRYDNLSSFFYLFGVRRHADGACFPRT